MFKWVSEVIYSVLMVVQKKCMVPLNVEFIVYLCKCKEIEFDFLQMSSGSTYGSVSLGGTNRLSKLW